MDKFHRSLRDKRQADRVKAVIALSRGWSAAQVAEILLFDEKTSRHYFDRYQKGGLETGMRELFAKERKKYLPELQTLLAVLNQPGNATPLNPIKTLWNIASLAER